MTRETEEHARRDDGPGASWPIFVVSLKDATGRRKRLFAELDRHGLVAEVVDAVDGRNGLPASCEPHIDREAAQKRVGRPLSDGEFACALSHQAIYRRIVEQGLPGAVVLEDDAILSSLFADFIARRGYLEADFIQMDHLDARVSHRFRRRWSEAVTLRRLAANASLASGYALSQGAARFILDRSTPIGGLADWPCDLLELDPLITLPRIVSQSEDAPERSSLDSGRAARLPPPSSRQDRRRRFFRRSYWRRWWFKRRTQKVS